jgi:hypothetical protein
MKKFRIILIPLLLFIVGASLGYWVGARNALNKAYSDITSDDLRNDQHAIALEARGYLNSLQALDSGRPEDLAKLRHRALSIMKVYVSDVQDVRTLGHTWSPDNKQVYTNVMKYLADHPQEK